MNEPTTLSGATPPEVDYVSLKAGQLIGRYEIVSVLGQGGFGITYRARDMQLSREVAIKEYLPSALAVRQDGSTVLPRTTKMADDFGWGRDRFVTEGRTLASLHRVPAIVQVFDFLEANGTAYIVMELLSGVTLEERINTGGKLKAAEVDRILWPLLDGLEQVHAAGFLHRDIKPANILLDAAGNPTLIDFGASRAAMVGRTAAMTAIFTPGYAAAEQMTSAKQGPWTDIYGLAATIYHAIAGKAPPNAFDRMLDDGYEPLGKLAPQGFSPGLLAGVDAGLIVLTSFISPFRSERLMARELLESDEFIEVFVSTPLAVAESRDPKGLYAKARRGEIKNFTGIDSDYEQPEKAEIVVDTSANSAEACADAILDWLDKNGRLSPPR